ncbi:MAG: LysR family transcriptional regulator [Candidatus Omnitrophica bacterium]|nr:LysR family transcriptional regulator [Candidatus Omnitrophota bacterium]
MVNLFFLKTFVDVAKVGSLRAAAYKNYVSQPAVTQHIQLLEEKLQCKLFERQKKKVLLTPCGRVFLASAENILKLYEEAKMKVGETQNRFEGTIRIATIYSIGLYELQPLIRSFLRRYPKIDIHLEYQPFNKIYEMVMNQSVDFGFVAFPKRKYGVISETFAEEELVLAQSPHHPVIPKKKTALRELNQAKFVAFRMETPTRGAIDEFLKKNGAEPRVVNEYDNIETLKSAILLGLGCSIVPKNTILRELKDRALETIPLQGLSLKRPLGILHHKGKAFTRSTQDFYEMIVKR